MAFIGQIKIGIFQIIGIFFFKMDRRLEFFFQFVKSFYPEKIRINMAELGKPLKINLNRHKNSWLGKK